MVLSNLSLFFVVLSVVSIINDIAIIYVLVVFPWCFPAASFVVFIGISNEFNQTKWYRFLVQ